MESINPTIRVQDFEDCTIHTFPYQGMDLTIADYLIAAFSEAEEINVLVGYFRVSFFQALAPVLAIIYHSKKQVKIICGHQLSEVELKVLYPEEDGIPVSEKSIDELVKSIWNTYFTEKRMSAVEADVLVLLHHLIDVGQLQIKPVFVKSDTTSMGLFHQKEYLFKGDDWLSRATGSANLTASGVSRNSESLDVRLENLDSLRSNTEDRLRFAEAVWTGDEQNHVFASKEEVAASVVQRHRDLIDGGLDVEEVSKRLFERVRETCSTQGLRFVEESPYEYPVREILPIEKITLRKHQEEAIKKWHEWGNVGLFEMATGAGKTITAVRCVWEIDQKFNEYTPVIVLVPGMTLVDQWRDEFSGLYPGRAIVCTSGSGSPADWRGSVEAYFTLASTSHDSVLAPIVIGIYGTVLKFFHEKRASSWHKVLTKALVICDECHSLGAPTARKYFNKEGYRFLVGLSATPERQFDEVGSDFISDVFQLNEGKVFRYDLKQAIDDEYLCRYRYHVIPFELDEISYARYTELTEEIIRCGDPEEGSASDGRRKRLLFERVRVLTRSESKYHAFKNWLKEQVESDSAFVKSMLVFSPVGFGDEEGEIRVIDRYLELLADSGLRCAKYIGGAGAEGSAYDSPLKSFSGGHLDALVAMQRLDEGVDLPRASCGVFLASSGSVREHIQRRGRILRLHNDKTEALVVDFLCLPYEHSAGYAQGARISMERGIIRRELQRLYHFSSAAINEVRIQNEIMSLLQTRGWGYVWSEVLNNVIDD